MSEHRPVYKKGSLLYATIVALACVMTASVSTFAWFQAEANVRISTTNSSTTITVSAPDPIPVSFYVYKGNNGTIGSTSSSDATGYPYTGEMTVTSFSDAFVEIEDDNPSNSTAGLFPGKRLTFCIRLSDVKGTFSAKVNEPTDTNTMNRYYWVDSTHYSEKVKMSWAINLYGAAYVVTHDEFPTKANVESFLNEASPSDKFLDSFSGPDHDRAFASQTASDQDIFFFYTIEFSDLPASYMKQVDVSGQDVYLSSSTASDSYWVPSTDGSSEAYEGLEFNIKEILIY